MLLGRVEGWRHAVNEHIDSKWWKLYQSTNNPLRFIAAVGDRILTPPHLYVHDHGSIPQWAQSFMGLPAGRSDVAQFAGVVYPLHDWAYEHQHWDNGDPLDRRDADELLRCALEQVGCAEWYYRMVYMAVRLGGVAYWNKHKGEPCSRYGG
jgi:hypothetical protein